MEPRILGPGQSENLAVARRQFLQRAGRTTLAATAACCVQPWTTLAAKPAPAVPAIEPSAESIVKTLYDSLSPRQRETICFAWNHQDTERGLLRSRVSNNWMVTAPSLDEKFYNGEQREMVRAILEGIVQPEWHERIYRQQQDDSDGFGTHNSIAIFGEPGAGKFEFVLTGRHMTLRCDGNSAEHVAFGGPIFYGHAADGFHEGPEHPGNVFWPQAVEANRLYQALDGKQQKLALVENGLPSEESVAFRGAEGKFQGIPLSEFSADQRERVQEVLRKLVEPYRQSDRDEVVACLKAQGGLDACHLAFYREGNLGKDEVWDNWRLEGPAFVWHYRGAPHVHVWVNVAEKASVQLNA